MKMIIVVAAAVVSALVLIGLGALLGLQLNQPGAAGATPSTPAPPDRRDFMFQVEGFKTKNQGGQTINLFFHYRYDNGIADNQIPNYEDLRTQALAYLAHVDIHDNPYWETLDKTMCTQLSTHFPIEAISCQLQVFPDDRPGLPYEPGYHSTIYTIGDIDPLALPGPTGRQA